MTCSQDGGFSSSQQPCLYSPALQTFSCQLPLSEGDNSNYVVSLCVANTVGSRSSTPETFQGHGIGKSPPALPCILLTRGTRSPAHPGTVQGRGELGLSGCSPAGIYVGSCLGAGQEPGLLPRALTAPRWLDCPLSPTVQPDPPANITVTSVPGNSRWLRVSWQDPPSWNSHYYRLKFELRYRALRAKTFTTWQVN